MPNKLAVIAIGGNSLITDKAHQTVEDQYQAAKQTTYHIADTSGLLSAEAIRHRPIGLPSTARIDELVTQGWLPDGPVVIGLTAGASTPNNIVGQVIDRLERLAAGTSIRA